MRGQLLYPPIRIPSRQKVLLTEEHWRDLLSL